MKDFHLLSYGLSQVLKQFLTDVSEFDTELLKRVFGKRQFNIGGSLWFLWQASYRREEGFCGYELFFTAGSLPFRVWLVDSMEDFKENWRWAWLKAFRVDPTTPIKGVYTKASWNLVKDLFGIVRDITRARVLGKGDWRKLNFSKATRWLFLAWFRTLFEFWDEENFQNLFLRGRKPELKDMWVDLLGDQRLRKLLEEGIPPELWDEPIRPWRLFNAKAGGLAELGGMVWDSKRRVYFDTEPLLFQDERVQQAWGLFLEEVVDYLACPVIVVRKSLVRNGNSKLFVDVQELCSFLARATLVYWCRRVRFLEDIFTPYEWKKVFNRLMEDYYRLIEKALSQFGLKGLDKRGYTLLTRLKQEALSQCFSYFEDSLTAHYGTFVEPFIVPFVTWKGKKEIWWSEKGMEKELRVPRLVFLPFYNALFKEEFGSQDRLVLLSDDYLKGLRSGVGTLEEVKVAVSEVSQSLRVSSFLKQFVQKAREYYQQQWLNDEKGSFDFWVAWIEPAFPSAEHLWWHLYRHKKPMLDAIRKAEMLNYDAMRLLKKELEQAFLSLFSRNLSEILGRAYLNSPRCKAKNLDNAQRTVRNFFSKSGRNEFLSLVHAANVMVEKYRLKPVAAPKKKFLKTRPSSLLCLIRQQKQSQPEPVFLPKESIENLVHLSEPQPSARLSTQAPGRNNPSID